MNASFADRFATRMLASRRIVVVGLIALTLVALAGLYDPIRGVPRLRIDPSLNEMLPADDPARQFYEELLTRFGSDDVVLIALVGDALFTPEGLDALIRTTDALAAAPHVHRVEGLATALRIRPIDDDVEIAGFFEDPVDTQTAAAALRRELVADPLRAGSLVSSDGRASAILVTFERMPEDEFLAQNVDLATLEVARQAVGTRAGLRVVMAGTPHVKAEVGRLLTTELAVMVPIVLVLMAGLSCSFFRSVRLGLVPLASVALGLVWTLGVMGWTGHDLNVVTTLIPPLVLALGFAYSTHVVAGFAVDREGPGLDRARCALAHAAFPVTFTALTTAAGFLSLLGNGLEVVRGFGVFAAVSTGATLLAAMTLAPLMLAREGTASVSRRCRRNAVVSTAHSRLWHASTRGTRGRSSP